MGAGNDILVAINQLRAEVAEVKALLLRNGAAGGSGNHAPAPPAVAPDADLDSEHGDPKVKFEPKKWKGDISCKGARLSECPSAFLEIYAAALEWSAANPRPGKEKYAQYDRDDAARARGWAARNKVKEAAEAEL